MKIICFIFLMILSNADAFSQSSPAYKDETFTEYFRRTSGWTASDATISVPTSCNKTIWLFGDSHIDGYRETDNTIPCLFQVRNSMMVQDLQNQDEFITILDNHETGVNKTPVKLAPNDTTYFWPSHGYTKKDTTIIFWQQYSGKDFTHRGNYFIKIYNRDFISAENITELTKLDLPSGIEFGVSVVVDSAENYVYLYGQQKDWIINRPYLARYLIGEDPTTQWEFYAGNDEWSNNVADIEQLMDSTTHYVSPSYSVIKLQDKYYMISQEIGFLTCGLGREIYSWESDTPYGPFKNKKTLYTIEDKYEDTYMITYNATAHPEFIQNNELLISYNVNDICPSQCEGDAFSKRKDADTYRPKFIRVPLTYIDPELNVPDAVFCDPGTLTGSIPDSGFPELQLYPNPSAGSFKLSGAGSTSQTPVAITVRNIFGKKLFEEKVYNLEKTIHLPEAGVYIVLLEYQGLQKIEKAIVRH